MGSLRRRPDIARITYHSPEKGFLGKKYDNCQTYFYFSKKSEKISLKFYGHDREMKLEKNKGWKIYSCECQMMLQICPDQVL